MKLKDLAKDINLTLKLNPERGENRVVVNLKQFGIGSGAKEPIKSAGNGMDWDKGNFVLYPSKALIHKDKDRDIVIQPVKKQLKGSSRSYYYCGKCHLKVAKDDSYCKHCGQKMYEVRKIK